MINRLSLLKKIGLLSFFTIALSLPLESMEKESYLPSFAQHEGLSETTKTNLIEAATLLHSIHKKFPEEIQSLILKIYLIALFEEAALRQKCPSLPSHLKSLKPYTLRWGLIRERVQLLAGLNKDLVFLLMKELSKLLAPDYSMLHLAADLSKIPAACQVIKNSIQAHKLVNDLTAIINQEVLEETPLIAALKNGSFIATRCILGAGAFLEVPKQKSPLHSTVEGGDPLLLTLLLQHHPNLEATNSYGQTALLSAIEKVFPRAVQLLLANGADPNCLNDSEEPALVEVCEAFLETIYHINSLREGKQSLMQDEQSEDSSEEREKTRLESRYKGLKEIIILLAAHPSLIATSAILEALENIKKELPPSSVLQNILLPTEPKKIRSGL